ncbi:hypothetical protein [Streptomyces microflavus]|uniref:hypothetical protein n=1 Tax=Streptomyces microflavus TaxID=1919 RepID=UPI0037F8BCD1
MNDRRESNSVRDSTIIGPVQVAGSQVNNFLGPGLPPSPHDLLRDRSLIAQTTYWQMKRDLLLWVWSVFVAAEFAGTVMSILVMREVGLGYSLKGYLHWIALTAALGWLGDALFLWARRRLESRDNPLLTRGGPVLLHDFLPRLMLMIFGVALYLGAPHLFP